MKKRKNGSLTTAIEVKKMDRAYGFGLAFAFIVGTVFGLIIFQLGFENETGLRDFSIVKGCFQTNQKLQEDARDAHYDLNLCQHNFEFYKNLSVPAIQCTMRYDQMELDVIHCGDTLMGGLNKSFKCWCD